MAVFKEGGSFETFNDVSGNPLIALNRDGTVTLVGIDFADGTTQKTASSGGGSGTPAAPTESIQFNNAGVFGGSSSLFWDNTNSYLGIVGPGASSPQPGITASHGGPGISISGLTGTFAELEMHNGGGNVGMELYTHRDSNDRFSVTLWRSRGTQAAPTAVKSSDALGSLFFGGFDGATWQAPGAGITAVATEDWSAPSNRGTKFLFQTYIPGGGPLFNSMTFSDGLVGIGNANPMFALQMGPGSQGGAALGAPPSAPTDGNLAPGQIFFYLDEVGNNLNIRVKYSNGTLKTATVALT
jgi:hypothetical protein